MNLMRQREDLKEAGRLGCLKPKTVEAALNSPVFQWWSGSIAGESNDEIRRKGGALTEEENEFIHSYLMETIHVDSDGPDKPSGNVLFPKFTPYPCFRISYLDQPIYEQWIILEDEGIVCFRCDDGYSQNKVKIWSLHIKTRKQVGYWRMMLWMNGVAVPMNELKQDGPLDEVQRIHIGKVTMRYSRRFLGEWADNVINMLGVFLFDIYGAGKTVIKVSPKPDATKSVQWRLAREHYVVLHRKQVEKLRESKGHITDEDLIRSAHWRRAHLRRLSSHKFINKRGLLVPVKRAWVGPEEWEGKDGKIYTVVGMEPPPISL